MTDTRGAFAVNTEDVAAKVIDGELIVIRLSDGTYYSTEHVGTTVWQLLEGGHDVASIVRLIAAWHAQPQERVMQDVSELVRELLAEQLIVPRPAPTSPAEPASPEAPLPYAPPHLGIYRDMGNLLALDPPTPGIDDLMFNEDRAP